MRRKLTNTTRAILVFGVVASLSGCMLTLTLGGGPWQAFTMGNVLIEWCDGAVCLYCPRGRTCIDMVNPASDGGTIQEWQIYVSGPETIKLKIFRDDGAGQYVFVGESALESAVAGMNTFECSIPGVQAGDYVGFYVVGTGTATVRAKAGGGLPYAHIGDVIEGTSIGEWFPASGITGQFSIYAIGCGAAP
ncbi:hypothetical protein ACFLS0_05490 [Candidatus Bipolaricaulota bacterium]